jgi:hypothetical protein
MECTYCGAELEYEDSYGNRDYICHDDRNGKRGDIYRCPNHEGFQEIEGSINHILCYYNKENENLNQEELNKVITDYLEEFGITDLIEVTCDSSTHNVSGSFYTDCNGNLYEGYPC